MSDTIRRLRELQAEAAGYPIDDPTRELRRIRATLIHVVLPLLLDIADAALDVVTMNRRFPLNHPRVVGPGSGERPASFRLADALIALNDLETT